MRTEIDRAGTTLQMHPYATLRENDNDQVW